MEKQEKNELIIERAANGFIVTLPPSALSDSEKAMENAEKVMSNFISKLNDEADPLLSELQGKEERPVVKLPKEELEEADNIFVFKTFAEVLGFLADRLDYLMPL